MYSDRQESAVSDCDLASCPEAEARSTFPLAKHEKRNLLLPNP